MSDHRVYMEQAIAMARQNIDTGDGGPFGAVIVRDGQVVGRGRNGVTSSLDPTAHAEIVAIRDACANLKTFHLEDCDIYTSCEPCPMCLGAIYWARLRAIYYAANRQDAARVNFSDEFIYEQIGVDPRFRVIPARHVEHPAALEVFRLWQDKEDRIDY